MCFFSQVSFVLWALCVPCQKARWYHPQVVVRFNPIITSIMMTTTKALERKIKECVYTNDPMVSTATTTIMCEVMMMMMIIPLMVVSNAK